MGELADADYQPGRRLLGAYEGLRGYHLLPEGPAALVPRNGSTVTGLTHAAELSQVPLLPEELAALELDDLERSRRRAERGRGSA